LEQCRAKDRNLAAAESVLAHIKQSCRGARDALASAEPDGVWLAAGPIRPGMRRWHDARRFYTGNAAGEAHPVIAEGISMAVQSSWLLCHHLDQAKAKGLTIESLDAAGRNYARAWCRSFSTRLRTSVMIAHWAMSPILVNMTRPILKSFPSILAAGARLAGKARMATR
jgi:flavin-dependent dehydrogenase